MGANPTPCIMKVIGKIFSFVGGVIAILLSISGMVELHNGNQLSIPLYFVLMSLVFGCTLMLESFE